MDLLIMIAVFGVIMYFLMIRPQQKRAKEHQATIDALQPGTRVLLTSGMFGTIRHIGQRQMIVELAPGTEITILKGNVARVITADEEEFEFSDELDEDAVTVEASSDDDFNGLADGLEPSHFADDTAGQEFDPRPDVEGTDTSDGTDADDESGKNNN